MNDLIEIEVVERNGVQTVNARELYEALEVKSQFSQWIKRRIDQYGLIEGKDFYLSLGESMGGRPGKDYFLIAGAAKELAGGERSNKGRRIRQYLLKVEEAWYTMMAKAVVLTEKEVLAYEHLGAAMAMSPFPGSLANGIPASVIHINTAKEDGGRVYVLEYPKPKSVRFIIIYGPNGEFKRYAPVELHRGSKWDPTPWMDTKFLEKEFMDMLGEWKERKKVHFDDFFRWKSSLIRRGITQQVTPDPISWEEHKKLEAEKKEKEIRELEAWKEEREKEDSVRKSLPPPPIVKNGGFIDDPDEENVEF